MWEGRAGASLAIRALARVEFLKQVVAIEPAVLAGLRDEVLPVYLAAYEEVAAYQGPELLAQRYRTYEQDHGLSARFCHSPLNVSRWRTVARAEVTEDSAIYPDLVPLREAIEAWSSRWLLNESWVQETALVQLEWWRQRPVKAAKRRRLSWFPFPMLGTGAKPRARERRPASEDGAWDPTCQLDWWRQYPVKIEGPGRLSWLPPPVVSLGVPLQPEERIFSFEHPGWDPTRETRKAAQAAIRADLEQKLEQYLDGLEARVSAAEDFERSEDYLDMRRRLEWLVLYQLKDLNFSEIGRRAHLNSRKAVKEVRAAAELVGVTLRPVQRGAPKGRRARRAGPGVE